MHSEVDPRKLLAFTNHEILLGLTMSLLQILAIALFLIICILLIVLILLQSNKGGGLGLIGGGTSETAYRSATTDIVTKITWGFLVAFFVSAIIAAILFAESTPELSDVKDEIIINDNNILDESPIPGKP